MPKTCLHKLVLATSFFTLNLFSAQIDNSDLFNNRTISWREFMLDSQPEPDTSTLFSAVNFLNLQDNDFYDPVALSVHHHFFDFLQEINLAMCDLSAENRHSILQLIEGAYLTGNEVKLSLSCFLSLKAFKESLHASLATKLGEEIVKFISALQKGEKDLQTKINKYTTIAQEIYLHWVRDRIARKEHGIIRTWFSGVMLMFAKTPMLQPISAAFCIYEFAKWVELL